MVALTIIALVSFFTLLFAKPRERAVEVLPDIYYKVLNLMTNIFLLVFPILLAIAGYTVEAVIVTLSAVVSFVYHVLETEWLGKLDVALAIPTAFFVAVTAVRAWTVRPNSLLFWLSMLCFIQAAVVFAVCAWAEPMAPDYAYNRVAHALWHVLGGLGGALLVADLWRSTEKDWQPINVSASITYDLFTDKTPS